MLLIIGHADDEAGCPYRVAHTPTECHLAGFVEERTPDGHPQVWLLYRPEPFAPGSDDDRSLHLWVRRADVFTSRDEATTHLENLLGHQVRWDRYAELHGGFWPELWIGFDHRGYRWLMESAPVNPPGGRV